MAGFPIRKGRRDGPGIPIGIEFQEGSSVSKLGSERPESHLDRAD